MLLCVRVNESAVLPVLQTRNTRVALSRGAIVSEGVVSSGPTAMLATARTVTVTVSETVLYVSPESSA